MFDESVWKFQLFDEISGIAATHDLVEWKRVRPGGQEKIQEKVLLKGWEDVSNAMMQMQFINQKSNFLACQPTRISGHSWSVWSCAWSPDGQQILSGSDDDTLKLWDVVTGACPRTFYVMPEGQWASIDEPTALTVDAPNGSVQNASPEAWRWLGWLIQDSPKQIPRCVSIEAFGPIPGRLVPTKQR